jgi:hypothetical protein
MTIKITNELPPITVTSVGNGAKANGDYRKDCCRIAANLEYHIYDPINGIICLRCKRCGCRHFELNAEPGNLGLCR